MVGKLDSEIIEKFKEFQQKKRKYLDLVIEDIKLENVSLSSISLITMGQSPESQYLNKKGYGKPFFQGKTDYGDMYLKEPTTWTKKSKKDAKKNDILISLRAPAGAINIANIDLSIGRGLASIRCNDNIFLLYLYYFLKNNEMKISSDNENGGFFSSMNKNYLFNISIPIPKDLNKFYSSYQIQEAIVEFLEDSFKDIESIRERIDKRYAIFERLKKALIPSTFIRDYVKNAFGRYAKEKEIGFSITDVEFTDVSFDYFFDIVTPPKKIKNKESKSIGKYPIVSQSEGLINGYTDYEEGYIDAEAKPIIIFGDHTTIVKYIDFKFFAGADGTKILKPKNKLLPKYTYYQSLNKVKQQGYQRHFQYLKKNNFLIPKDLKDYSSLEIQKIIADFIEYTENRLQKEFDRMDRGYHNLERLHKTYLARTFSLIDWRRE